jgi:type II secretory pathway pseudopilin PulG
MTKIILIALIAALASPAFAAPKKHSRNANSREAYAQAQQRQTQRHSTNPNYDEPIAKLQRCDEFSAGMRGS